jgi:hypothetical protein
MCNFVIQKPEYDKKKLYNILTKKIDSVLKNLPVKDYKCNDFLCEIEINGFVHSNGHDHQLSIQLAPHNYFINVKYITETSEDHLDEVLNSLRSNIEKL